MKTTFKFIIAAMAAISVFSSCQKELANETVNNTTGGVRVISVQFDNSTKATFDGFTPKFANGDAIRVSNTEKSEECTVSVDGSGNATFLTTLSGDLTAIYPSAAAVLSSGEADAPIASSNNFKVLATQDGTVEKAIIASATVAEGENTATFNGLTALFEIAPPSGATSITITSLNKIDATTGRRSTTANAAVINTEGADDAAKRVINVTVPSDGTAYVALKAGVNLTDLSFDAGETYGMKGIPAKDIAAAGKTDATAANTKYTIGNTNWHPYVEMTVQLGLPPSVTKTYKWATMNIGATSATEAGKYFMWGETTGITPSGSSFSFPDSKYYSADNNSWDQTKGFKWENCPWTNGTYTTSSKNVFTKYVPSDKTNYWGGTGSPDDKPTLDLADDAANANWGGSWRMPTTEEVFALGFLTKEWKTNYNNSGVNGFLFTDENGHKIFLPAAGYSINTSLTAAGEGGYYWSSSLTTNQVLKADSFRCLPPP